MTGTSTVGRALLMLVLCAPSLACAADQLLPGRKLLIRNPTGAEANRAVVILGKSSVASMSLVGDPTVDGASLQVVANGGSSTTQLLTLGAAGWTATATGYRYTGPTAGEPVRRVKLERTPDGRGVVTAVLRGRTGTTDLVVTPPDPGDDGGLVLALGGGDRYCVAFGGGAGGTELNDDAARWRIGRSSGLPGCPSSPSITTTSTTSTTSTTAPPACGSTGPACDGPCPPNHHCEPFIAGCVCVTGGSSNCAVCDTPCTGGQVCARAIDASSPPDYTETCECVTPPVCGSGSPCGGSCPTGATCLVFAPGPMCACYFEP